MLCRLMLLRLRLLLVLLLVLLLRAEYIHRPFTLLRMIRLVAAVTAAAGMGGRRDITERERRHIMRVR